MWICPDRANGGVIPGFKTVHLDATACECGSVFCQTGRKRTRQITIFSLSQDLTAAAIWLWKVAGERLNGG